MPKRASEDDAINPVRSRLAAQAAAPVPPPQRPAAAAAELLPQVEQPAETVGEGRGRPFLRPHKPSNSSSLTINRKVMITPEEAERIEQSTGLISAAFGSRVTYSQVSRALWSILAGAEDAIKAGARRAPKLSVPSKGNHVGMAEYEEALADFLITALKRS